MPQLPPLYPRSFGPLSSELFARPPREYRGAPFWSWNNRLAVRQLLRQLGQLKAMGLGGAMIHCRTGMATPYLGDEFMSAVRACVGRAHELDMLVWLYDEDRWPSGYGGGLVTREEKYRAKYVLFTPRPYGGTTRAVANVSGAGGGRNEQGTLLAAYDVELDERGCLKRYERVRAAQGKGEQREARPGAAGMEGSGERGRRGERWYAYLETSGRVPWFNNEAYADTLSPEAIARFVEVTHEAYKRAVGEEFGGLIPAMFTDEPQFVHKQSLARPTDTPDLHIPWTTDLAATFEAAWGFDILERLPEVFWELPAERGVSKARYAYHDHVAERFAGAFADTCGAWCRANGLRLTGHMMEEPTLHSQTHALGEAMRSYRAFDLPGIDMLCDWREYTTAKQAQSACHQFGGPGVLSELYGVTNWDFTFTGHKSQGDWQAALGVTVRVHHLAWVSMKGEAKRDYPAAIGYQSPWYTEYPVVEDHFARVNVLMTRGRPVVRVGVIHPVESYWLCFGPQSQTAAERDQRETSFKSLTEWLLFGLVDFDFIAESLLPSQTPTEGRAGSGTGGARFAVGQMAYDVVVVPPMRTMRRSTLERLEAFASAGGRVVFAGEVPGLVDAEPSDRAEKLATAGRRVEFSRVRLLEALEDVREVRATLSNGSPAQSLLHQLREEGETRYLFVCNTDRFGPKHGTAVELRGRWSLEAFDTMTGTSAAIAAEHVGETTRFTHDFAGTGHVLLRLTPAKATVAPPTPGTAAGAWHELPRPTGPAAIALAEPNVLLLDQAQWRFAGDATWQPLEEILRLDNLVRRRLGLPDRTGEVPQPWTDTAPAPELARVELKFTIETKVAIEEAKLALEDAELTAISLDGRSVANAAEGYFTDEAIGTVRLPAMSPGRHELVLSRPFTRKSELEWVYLLGDFGVRVGGRFATVVSAPREAGFSDLGPQGLPFYGGNVTYRLTIDVAGQPGEKEVMLEVPRFAAPVLTVSVDGKALGPVAFPPYRISLGRLAAGQHVVEITSVGNRFNSFGALHCFDRARQWWGPDAYRTTGEGWAYEYNLRPTGLLAAPRLFVREEA